LQELLTSRGTGSGRALPCAGLVMPVLPRTSPAAGCENQRGGTVQASGNPRATWLTPGLSPFRLPIPEVGKIPKHLVCTYFYLQSFHDGWDSLPAVS